MRTRLPINVIPFFAAQTMIFGMCSGDALSDEPDTPLKFVMPMLAQHCVECHGENHDVAGEVDLFRVDRDDLANDAELLRRLIDVLDLRRMPPEDEPPLGAKQASAGDRGTEKPAAFGGVKTNRFCAHAAAPHESFSVQQRGRRLA